MAPFQLVDANVWMYDQRRTYDHAPPIPSLSWPCYMSRDILMAVNPLLSSLSTPVHANVPSVAHHTSILSVIHKFWRKKKQKKKHALLVNCWANLISKKALQRARGNEVGTSPPIPLGTPPSSPHQAECECWTLTLESDDYVGWSAPQLSLL